MQRYIDGRSVKGATHVRNGAPLQDSYKIVKYSEDISIISVAMVVKNVREVSPDHKLPAMHSVML